MARKRKAAGAAAQSSQNKTTYDDSSRFGPDERFADSEDEFQAGRDHILLEERPEAKRRRKLEEDGEWNLMLSKRGFCLPNVEQFLQPSDSEVHEYASDSEDENGPKDNDNIESEDVDFAASRLNRKEVLDSGSAAAKTADNSDDEITGWGSSKADYYNADIIETEGDAIEEEAEAKKLQRNKLQSMTEADYGFDDLEWLETIKQPKEPSDHVNRRGKMVTEVLPGLQIPDGMIAEEKRELLAKLYPEFEPLSKDFATFRLKYSEFAAAAAQASRNTVKDLASVSPLPVVQFRILTAYLGALSMYFVILTSPANDSNGKTQALPPTELRQHPIMETLVGCRQQWEQVGNMQPASHDHSESLSHVDIKLNRNESSIVPDLPISLNNHTTEAMSKPLNKTKAQRHIEKAQALRRLEQTKKLNKTELGLKELSTLLHQETSTKTTTQRPDARDDDSDFGDETHLSVHESAEKAKRKKSLRFYTSQITQKANKRGAAGRDAGGDTDIPYRERLKDRQSRLNVEAEKRGRKEATKDEQLGGDSDEEDYKLAKELRGVDSFDTDGYYDTIVLQNKDKKEMKRLRAEAHAAAAKENDQVEFEDTVGPDGKRKISYAIEKNKGLAPKRNKDVRNPRVKKRKKFESKKKKLGSIKQIYKGGEGRGGYAGELTGIKKNLVKSVKL
ncbi:hypothetical protein FQN57_002502 [Myotisia sp. PD_48]|nr:hypothetical protein FQN57_002502 [Myotisia sp. PD_48]